MKITLAFLLLGLCLALTNAMTAGKRQMSTHAAVSHCRITALILIKVESIKKCQSCAETEKRCMENNVVEDMMFMLRLLAYDKGVPDHQIYGQLGVKVDINIMVRLVHANDIAGLVRLFITSCGSLEKFVHICTTYMSQETEAAGVNMFKILDGLNKIFGGLFTGSLQLILNLAANVLGGALEIAGGLTNVAGGFAENMVGGVTDVVGGLTNVAGGLAENMVGGLTNVAGGVTEAVTGVAGNLLGSVTEKLGGLTSILNLGGGSKGKKSGGGLFG